MPENEDIVSGFVLELRRGTIILCVLSELKNPMYGYSLVSLMNEKGISIEANTLYPLLRRLEKQGLLKSEWETTGAKPRKYYMVTELGEQIYIELKQQWNKMVDTMNQFMN